MAEGGDTEMTNPFDPNEGADERTPLYPHRDEEGIGMKDRTSTSTSRQRGHHSRETYG